MYLCPMSNTSKFFPYAQVSSWLTHYFLSYHVPDEKTHKHADRQTDMSTIYLFIYLFEIYLFRVAYSVINCFTIRPEFFDK